MPPLVSTAILVAVYFAVTLLIPRPAAVKPEAWRLLGIFAATIAGLILQPIAGGALVLIAVTLATLFGGLTARNHPTIRQKGTEIDPTEGNDVEGGPMNLVISAGVESELGAGIKASLIAYGDASRSPVQYPLGVAATVTIPLGPRDAPTPTRP